MKIRNIPLDSGLSDQTAKSAQKVISESTSIKLASLPVRPLVSVVITNYNYGRYLDEAIRSIQAQTYGVFEIIICDDGSTDNSEEIYQRYSTDRRIRIIRQEHGGQGKAMTQTFDASRGEIICFLDADDMFFPTKLELVVDAFLTYPQAGVCTHFLQPVSKVGKALGTRVPRYLVSGWLATQALGSGGSVGFAQTSGLAIRREIGEYIFPIPDRIFHSGDAYIVCISSFIAQFVAIPIILSYYRWHGKNISGGQARCYESVAGFITIHDAIFQEQQNLLKRRFSAEIADRLALKDNIIYLYMLLWLHIFAGKRPGRLDDMRVKEIVNRLPKTFKSLMRRVLLRLPSAVSRLLNKIWIKRFYYFRWSAPLKVNNIS